MSYEKIQEALEILGLPTLITKEDIKRRYKELVKRYHPDRGGDAKKLQEIKEAYELLTEYIEGFRYTFSKDEVNRRYPSLFGSEDTGVWSIK